MSHSLTDQGPSTVWRKAQSEAQNWSNDLQGASKPSEFVPVSLQNYEHQMTLFAAEQDAELIRLRSEYVFDSPSVVTEFLKTHRSHPALLLSSVGPLRHSFGDESVLHLQVRTDGDLRILFALVFWKGPLDAAKKSLELFDQKWWLNNSSKASGNLVFDYELV